MVGIIINFAVGYGVAFMLYGKGIPARQPIPSDVTCFTKRGLKTHDDLLLKRVIQPVNPFPNASCQPIYIYPKVECENCTEVGNERFSEGKAAQLANQLYK